MRALAEYCIPVNPSLAISPLPLIAAAQFTLRRLSILACFSLLRAFDLAEDSIFEA